TVPGPILHGLAACRLPAHTRPRRSSRDRDRNRLHAHSGSHHVVVVGRAGIFVSPKTWFRMCAQAGSSEPGICAAGKPIYNKTKISAPPQRSWSRLWFSNDAKGRKGAMQSNLRANRGKD